VQPELFPILIQFRTFQVAVCADVEKMFRQIRVHQDDTDWQRILWRNSPDEDIAEYRLTTVTYGTACAPFLSTRTLRQLALDEKENYPSASSATLRHFYVDDLLSGAATREEAIQLVNELLAMFKKGGFHLRKWHSNDPSIFREVSTDSQVSDLVHFQDNDDCRVLGIKWSPKLDEFKFSVAPVELKAAYTKREILSQIAHVFDPLGLLSPCVTFMKILLQELWQGKFAWDQPLPSELYKRWRSFIEELHLIEQVAFPRYALQPHSEIEIHAFCDASEKAYCAAIYVRCISISSSRVTLLTSKTRVAPLKVQSIPRLELCSALLLTNLLHATLSQLDLPIKSKVAWSDSKIVLAWINSEPSKWKPFVANRVAQIQELSPDVRWNFVSGLENPADCGTRGLTPSKFVNCELWFNGPKWLSDPSLPSTNVEVEKIPPEEFLKEEKRTISIAVGQTVNDFCSELKNCETNLCMLNLEVKTFIDYVLNLTNDYAKLIRILSYIFRFTENCRGAKKFGPLSVSETRDAETFLIRLVQLSEFSQEVKDLKGDCKINPKSQVNSLFPFLDKNGIMRAGGRLANSGLNYDRKFPVILPKNHRLTMLIIEMVHKKYLHIGPQALLFQVRQRFWPINGRNMCRKIFHQCIVCFKAKPITEEQLMGNLPKERVTQNFPFNCVGVDFCGPFQIKYPNQRKGQLSKIYICIFVCLATKACHLELVNALTSDAFIATLKRFLNRRGKCAHIFSDNGKNFVGSNLELKRLANLVCKPDETLGSFFCNEGIDWSFIPPRAPNHGGLWEAGVKSVKFHLKRVVGNYKLTYEEFLTVLVQVEGILNSRPLYPLSAELDDFEILTPGHFLVGRPITAIAEPSVVQVADNKLTAWQKLTKIIQVIWKNWSNNYMSTLQQRNKWRFEKNNVRIGDVVLVAEENLPTCKWVVGRIIEVNPGNDGKIRVVKVKTQFGVFKRGISKIAILPLPD
jgi:hypothetical protein